MEYSYNEINNVNSIDIETSISMVNSVILWMVSISVGVAFFLEKGSQLQILKVVVQAF